MNWCVFGGFSMGFYYHKSKLLCVGVFLWNKPRTYPLCYSPQGVAKVDSRAQITNICPLDPMMLHSNTGQQQTTGERMKILSEKIVKIDNQDIDRLCYMILRDLNEKIHKIFKETHNENLCFLLLHS